MPTPPSPIGATADFDRRLAAFEARLGYPFADRGLLARAVTHRSWCAENDNDGSNERLEFLGDSVLGMVVARHVYETYPNLDEGRLSRLRAAVVNEAALAEFARSIDLGSVLRLSKGESGMDGADKPSILSDAFEAVLAAVFIDGGIVEVDALLLPMLRSDLDELASDPTADIDHKGRLQELLARIGSDAPRYEVRGKGPDHERVFTATVFVGVQQTGVGVGGSKKAAEQAAAVAAFEELS